MTARGILRFKAGVRLWRVTPALAHILNCLAEVASIQLDAPPFITITSINDGKHSPHSRHWEDDAVDVRLKDFGSDDAKHYFAKELRLNLGARFTVLLEDLKTPNEHLHIQVRKGHQYP